VSGRRFGKATDMVRQEPHHVVIHRMVLGALGAALILVAAWAVGATVIIVKRDDLTSAFLKRQVDQQFAYEERVASLRAHIDRLASRQLVEQDGIEARVAELISRQSRLENRTGIMSLIAKEAGAAEPQVVATDRPAENAARNTPITGKSTQTSDVKPLETKALETKPSEARPAEAKPAPVPEPQPLAGRSASLPVGANPTRHEIERIADSLRRIEHLQIAAITKVEERARKRVERMRALALDLGVDPDRLPKNPAAKQAVGGPLVPLSGSSDSDLFDTTIRRIQNTIDNLGGLKRLVGQMPLRHPLPGADMTSSYGARVDPFTRGMAMHTGIDFKAESGAPVRSTGAGKVMTAEYSGGYGRMVEIDHGHGLTTRYAHLSDILVSEGQTVSIGTVIGRVGSTGRSTGPHLHYETRTNGDAQDPQRFLRLGARYRDLL
jgi:murein DD-endopeptidase MepM/ murein hydrolase activator NlpD